MAKQDTSIISHWYQLFEGLQESPKQIYKSIEAAVAKRELPETSMTRVHYFEGGPFSAQREYLRVSRRDLIFDICAAHFGKGMFMSWWLSEDKSAKGIWKLVAVLLIAFFFLYKFVEQFGLISGLFIVLVVVLSLFFFVSWQVHNGTIKFQDSLLEIPIIGGLYERLFHPITYYKKDTAMMFQESVRLAVNEVIEEITKVKGIRSLSELERKPILKSFINQ